jgi:transposase
MCAENGHLLRVRPFIIARRYMYEDEAIEGLASFGHDGSACRLSEAQQAKLKAWIAETLPRTTREVGAWIESECGITYESRSGLIALLHRLDMEHRKPKAVSSKLDPDKPAPARRSTDWSRCRRTTASRCCRGVVMPGARPARLAPDYRSTTPSTSSPRSRPSGSGPNLTDP